MAMERGMQISVKIPSQVESLSKSLLDSYWSQYVLDELMYFWLVLLLKKYHPRHTAGLQKESHFPLKLWKSILSKSLALKTTESTLVGQLLLFLPGFVTSWQCKELSNEKSPKSVPIQRH